MCLAGSLHRQQAEVCDGSPLCSILGASSARKRPTKRIRSSGEHKTREKRLRELGLTSLGMQLLSSAA